MRRRKEIHEEKEFRDLAVGTKERASLALSDSDVVKKCQKIYFYSLWAPSGSKGW